MYKSVGIEVTLSPAHSAAFSSFIAPFFSSYLPPGSTPDGGAPVEHAAAGDGRTFTFWADADQIAKVRAASSNVVDDPLKEGDVVTIKSRGNSLFVREIEITESVRDKRLAGMHQISNMHAAKAVNVDEGLVENIRKAQERQAAMGKQTAAATEKKGAKDVEDEEWD